MPVKSGSSSIRDRTHEFSGIAERVKKTYSSNNNNNNNVVASRQEDVPRSAGALQSEFNRRASKIGFGIHQTSQKLSRLAQLAKTKSAYNDPTQDIQELTAVIKQEIQALNSAVVDLQFLRNSSNESGSTSADTTTHSTTVVDDLKNRLMSTTKEFKDVLTLRTENLKALENRKQIFSSKNPSPKPSNPFVRQRPLSKSIGASTSAEPALPWASGSPSSSQFSKSQVDGESLPLLQQQQNQQQQQQMVPVQDSYMQSRAEALQNVESTIHELGSIFNQLATLVSQQGEVAIRIDENMEDTLSNVEGAQTALLKYLNSISSNRWLMIKIFFVLMFFLMLFLFFVA